ncbi:MAG: polyprenyl synthetase family protein [Termitinemataceae bacterium]|nr:MAG: polyprenyl synthetase family protein [Termitinemataceae bacterium]
MNTYKIILERIEAVLFDAFPKDSNSKTLVEPCYELVSRGGKRWRPLLMSLVCAALGGGDAAIHLSPLVEFCHNASLIHDDIEDNSGMRRGKPCIHKLYGIDTAINSGCFLYFLPLICIDKWNAGTDFKLRLYTLWAENIRNLHIGQSLDISWHKNIDFIPSVEQYFSMCALKTGVLAKFAAITGSAAAESTVKEPVLAKKIAENGKIFAKAAENLGVAFQILDDVKNLTAQIAGKEKGDDIVEGKKSLPVLYFLQGAQDQERLQLVQRCWKAASIGGTSCAEVTELIAALETSGALDKAQKKGHQLLDESKKDFLKQSNIFEDFFEMCL